jgi:Fe-S cluster biogenesis protein NfuA
MAERTRVQPAIDRMRPLLRADGGDIELVDVSDRKAFVRLTGRCACCPSAVQTLHFGVERAIRDAWPELESVVVVRP